MKILALGNSFSQDCTVHIGRMTDAYVRNLYIVGCSLERHANNLESRIADYELQKDGAMLGDSHVAANEIIAGAGCDHGSAGQSAFGALRELLPPDGFHLSLELPFKTFTKGVLSTHRRTHYVARSWVGSLFSFGESS